jgi:hypothetical protein
LDLQRLDPLLGGCGGPAGVSHDGWHDAITSRTTRGKEELVGKSTGLFD